MKQKQNLIKKIKKMLKKDQQVNLPVLDRVHKALSAKSLVYKSWHSSQWQHITQWAVLAVVVIGVITLFSVNRPDGLEGLSSNASQTRGARSTEVQRLGNLILDKSEDFQKGDASKKSSLAPEMLELAKQRRAIVDAAVKDRQLDVVLQNIISSDEWTKLPSDVQAYIEQEKTIQGKFTWSVADYENSHEDIYRIEDKSGQRTAILVDKTIQTPDWSTGATVKATGMQVGNYLIALPEENSLNKMSSAPNGPANGSKKLGVILFKFQNSPATGLTTPTEARQMVFGPGRSVKEYFEEISDGSISISSHINPTQGDVFGTYTIPMNSNPQSCNDFGWDGQWTELAKQAAVADGFNENNYQYVTFLIPETCSWAGIATLGGKESVIDTPYAAYIAHELGHNFGRMHASSLRCLGADGATLVQVSDNCYKAQEYSDFDIMGVAGPMRHMSGIHKSVQYISQGTYLTPWIPSNNVQTLSFAGNPDGVYTINSSSSPSSGTQIIRIPKTLRIKSSSEDPVGQMVSGYYYIEVRSPVGYDAGSDAATLLNYNGVTIRFSSGYAGENTYLLDATPTDPNPYGGPGFADAPLAVGRTFSDPVSGINITTQSAGGGSATVRIQLSSPGPCVRNTTSFSVAYNHPSQPDVQTDTEVRAGQSFTSTVSLRNNDSNSCPGSDYTIARQQTQPGWSSTPAQHIVTLLPGQSVNKQFVTSVPASWSNGNTSYSFTATRNTGQLVTVNASNNVYVMGCPTRPALTLVSPSGNPTPEIVDGQSIPYTMILKNQDLPGGCAPSSTFTLTKTSNMNWGNISPSVITETLNAGEERQVTFNVTPTTPVIGDLYSVYLEANRQGGNYTTARNFSSYVQGIVCANPTVTLNQVIGQSAPGQSASYTMNVRNNDGAYCGASNFTIVPQNVPTGWTITPPSVSVNINGNAQISREFIITPSGNAAPGANNITLRAFRTNTPPVANSVTLTHTVTGSGPICTNTNPTVTISPTSGSTNAGSTMNYSVTLRNNDVAPCSSSTYNLAPVSVPTNWTMTPSSFSESLAPGASVTKTFAFGGPVGSTYGQNPITLRATRQGSTNITGEVTFNHTVLGPTSIQGPIMYIMSPISGQHFSTGSIPINTYAEINGGFIGSIVIKLNGNIIKTCTGPQWGSLNCDTSVLVNSFKGTSGTITAIATEFPTNQTSTSTVSFTKSIPTR